MVLVEDINYYKMQILLSYKSCAAMGKARKCQEDKLWPPVSVIFQIFLHEAVTLGSHQQI